MKMTDNGIHSSLSKYRIDHRGDIFIVQVPVGYLLFNIVLPELAQVFENFYFLIFDSYRKRLPLPML
jgi:hypothetical protein